MSKLTWWWLSYSDNNGRFLHVVIRKATDGHDADARAVACGLADSQCIAVAGEMPEEAGDPPATYLGRRLDRTEAAELAKAWEKGGRLMTEEETRNVYITGVVPRKAGS